MKMLVKLRINVLQKDYFPGDSIDGNLFDETQLKLMIKNGVVENANANGTEISTGRDSKRASTKTKKDEGASK